MFLVVELTEMISSNVRTILKYGTESGRRGSFLFYSIGNGDYFCLLTSEEVNEAVYYYSHENSGIEKEADDFQEWLIQLPFFLR
ncbi:SMI1/KNR4 family protein [Priestia koreensis]|uniref:SMI1/KNR4 family protein n=1 Tax=Priestia koreensis TaxID=284581 RepID=UPI003019A566